MPSIWHRLLYADQINTSRVNFSELLIATPLLLLRCAQHFLGMSVRDCHWQLPVFGHSNPRTVQKAPVFSFFANGTLLAYALMSKDPTPSMFQIDVYQW